MPELRRSRPADIRYYVGSSGSGKTWQVARDIERHRGRVLVWDFKDDHYELETAPTLAALARGAKLERVLRYVPSYTDVERQFDFFCRVAWTAQQLDTSDLLLVVEEVQEVTRASAPPEWWRRIVVQGRVYGFTVVATSTRPAFVDKAFTGNATMIRAGRLGERPDAHVVGQRIGVDPGALQRLEDRWAFVFDGRETRLLNPRGKAIPHVSATG